MFRPLFETVLGDGPYRPLVVTAGLGSCPHCRWLLVDRPDGGVECTRCGARSLPQPIAR
jgi:hypothetical protein